MGQIEDIEQKLESANVKLGLVSNTVVAIGKDVANLKAKIDSLSAGAITQEQLDALSSAANSVSDRVDSVAADLTAVDAETPDVPVAAPVEPAPPVENV